MTKSFTLPIRIYVYDTDYGGVVYHANYLKYMDQARTEWLASVGFTLEKLAAEHIHFAICGVDLNYLYPARLNTVMEIDSRVAHIGKSSITFAHIARNQADKNCIFCKGEIRIVCVNDAFSPTRIPKQIVEKLT